MSRGSEWTVAEKRQLVHHLTNHLNPITTIEPSNDLHNFHLKPRDNTLNSIASDLALVLTKKSRFEILVAVKALIQQYPDLIQPNRSPCEPCKDDSCVPLLSLSNFPKYDLVPQEDKEDRPFPSTADLTPPNCARGTAEEASMRFLEKNRLEEQVRELLNLCPSKRWANRHPLAHMIPASSPAIMHMYIHLIKFLQTVMRGVIVRAVEDRKWRRLRNKHRYFRDGWLVALKSDGTKAPKGEKAGDDVHIPIEVTQHVALRGDVANRPKRRNRINKKVAGPDYQSTVICHVKSNMVVETVRTLYGDSFADRAFENSAFIITEESTAAAIPNDEFIEEDTHPEKLTDWMTEAEEDVDHMSDDAPTDNEDVPHQHVIKQMDRGPSSPSTTPSRRALRASTLSASKSSMNDIPPWPVDVSSTVIGMHMIDLEDNLPEPEPEHGHEEDSEMSWS
ncbi:hypothetical protein DFS34DRAFT_599984 [Phlyctochytrium arcticum]|nr:hypothetical protein DFS34DRAFT_599984 [Phlyctochytrium arcticum]